MKTKFAASPLFLVVFFQSNFAVAWDYEGHRAVNQLALAALPKDFPAFVLTPQARERIAFLAGEPDRWRNTDDLSLKHSNEPDHYLDLDRLSDYGLNVQTLPVFRYDFTAKLALARAAHPERFAPIDPRKNKDHTRELMGFLPWTIVEYQARLKSAFSYLKTLQNYSGTSEEIVNAQDNVIYLMGVMGHFVGDGSQPLHLTKYNHGWSGSNPHGYTTNFTFHAWIDGGFFKKAGGIKTESLMGKIRAAKIVGDPLKPEDLFQHVMAYLITTSQEVEPLYQLEKQHKLSPGNGRSESGETFLNTQMMRGAQMLGDLWFSAWQQATEDKFMRGRLKARSEAVEEN